jgi:hypothetical protein
MTRRMLMLVLAAPIWAADLPSAASLLDHYVDVTGGKQAYSKRKSEIAHGTVEYAAMGLKGKLTRWATDSGLYRLTMEMPGIGALEAGVKDGVAWEQSQILGPRVKSGLEREEALREAVLNSNAKWRDLYPKVETAGEETIDGEACYKVVMTPKEGPPETLYLSKKTGLGVKLQATASTQMGDLSAEIVFADYKNFGGILTPARVTQSTAGQAITITIESVEPNPEIPGSVFDLPADVAALAAKQ